MTVTRIGDNAADDFPGSNGAYLREQTPDVPQNGADPNYISVNQVAADNRSHSVLSFTKSLLMQTLGV